MKQLLFIFTIFITLQTTAQNRLTISFFNDYPDVYHLALIFYKPDGTSQVKVSDVKPLEIKTYDIPEGTEIYFASRSQEAYAMKGNDIKASGAKPWLVTTMNDNKRTIKLTYFETAIQPDANDALGTWVIDLRPTPESEPYLKDFKFTKIEGKKFDGEFYGYPFSGGFLNTDWDKIYFAFTTADQSGTYYHSGYIEGNKVFGMSLNEARGLMLPWRGERKKEK
jgi:hypothetical protein